MEEKEIKWANCCPSNSPCCNCSKESSCRKWTQYVKNHRKTKPYAHFDERTSLADNALRARVLNPSWVSSHGFFPMISFEIKKDHYIGATAAKKAHLERKNPRVIRYCSHVDRCIYQRYAFLFDQQYNKVARCKGIDDVAIAYRTNKHANNLHFAKRALDFIERQDKCLILVSDFASYFDNIIHIELKDALCELFSVTRLPDDYYAVFKNVTRYSSWDWKLLAQYWREVDPKLSKREINSKELILPPEVFRDRVKLEAIPNTNNVGIPQGSPVSAVLSNIYLLDFDEMIQDAVRSDNGLYMRYCDDLFMAIPYVDSDDGLSKVKSYYTLIQSFPGVSIQEEKTRLYRFEAQNLSLTRTDFSGSIIKPNALFDYLGVSFDGRKRRVRPRTIAKYYTRLNRKAKTIAKQKSGRTNIYGTYSDKSHTIFNRRSFVDYLKDANVVLDINDDVDASKIIRHNREIIAKTIRRAENKRDP